MASVLSVSHALSVDPPPHPTLPEPHPKDPPEEECPSNDSPHMALHETYHRLHVAFRLAEATLSGKSTTLAGLKLQLWPASIKVISYVPK